MKVTLPPHLIEMAQEVGRKQHEQAKRMGICDRRQWCARHLESDDAKRIWTEIESKKGEIAVALALGTFDRYPDWKPPIGNFRNSGDVEDWDVRWTQYENGYLPLRPKDKSNRPMILVVGSNPYRLVGWAWPRERAEKGRVFAMNSDGPAYKVEQQDLYPMETLPRGGK